ncbi:MAG: hypothetical protein Q8O19_04840 [Rectinemataceae bacterium]|nr:hypothetical protein [Rectinemataceae bacterium]
MERQYAHSWPSAMREVVEAHRAGAEILARSYDYDAQMLQKAQRGVDEILRVLQPPSPELPGQTSQDVGWKL